MAWHGYHPYGWWCSPNDKLVNKLPSLYIYIYIPLVMTNIAMVYIWPIEIDGLPIKMVIFHGELLNNQMVIYIYIYSIHLKSWNSYIVMFTNLAI